MRCFDCGGNGHIAPDCPNREAAGINGKPPWCGFCDERTRLIDSGNSVSRCQRCHPLRRKPLPGRRACPSCHAITLSWDHAECGAHAVPSSRVPGSAA